MNLILIGYRGTGKSTVARLLAERLGWSWVDSDAEIERETRLTIAEIFAQHGEAGFREGEASMVAWLLEDDNRVVALGGGAVLREKTRQIMAAAGKVVWLRATAETIHQRLSADPGTVTGRPNLTASGGMPEIRDLLQRRQAIYQQCADLEVDTDNKDPAAVAAEILSWMEPQKLRDSEQKQ
ncbi:MAG: shikimate kinase [Planctomycetes bacterium]|nr:shikimate kinase [Planctomycetota bacterium]